MKRFLGSSNFDIKQETQVVSTGGDSQTDEMYDKFKSFLLKRHMTPEAIISNMGLILSHELELDNLTEIYSKARITLTSKNGIAIIQEIKNENH